MPSETGHKLVPQVLLISLSALATVLVIFIVGEITARVLRPARPKPNNPLKLEPSIGYEFKPRALYFGEQLNSEGFRSEDLPPAKKLDEFRILAVGDSTCFGFGTYRNGSWYSLPRVDTWPYILEQFLNTAPRTKKVEVINAGVPGYVSYQALERIKRRGLKYNPDIVIAMVGWNDLESSTLPEWKPNTDFSKMSVGLMDFRRDTIAHSRLLALLYESFGKLRKMYVRKQGGPPFNELALEIYSSNLEAMREVSISHGAVFVVVVQPALASVTPLPEDFWQKFGSFTNYYPLSLQEFREWYRRYVAVIRQFAREHPETILVDPTEAFNASPLKSDLFYDHAHLSPEGNRLMAAEIARVLQERGVLAAREISRGTQPNSRSHWDTNR